MTPVHRLRFSATTDSPCALIPTLQTMITIPRILTALIATTTLAFAEDKPKHPIGYQDTPVIPGTKWHVHDGERPQPTVVTPGEKLGDAPSDAIVLFDGRDFSRWKNAKGEDSQWKVENGYVEVAP